MREGEAVRGTEIIIDSATPSFFHFILATITFLLIILKAVSCCAAPFETVMVIVFFLRTFEGEVVRAIFSILTSPGEVPAASSLIVFCDGIAVRIIVIVFIDAVEDGSPEGVAIGIDPRAGVGDGIVLTVAGAAEFPVEIDLIACAAEVRITELDDADCTVRVRVAGADSDDAGLLLDNIDLDDDIMFIFFAGEQLHVDIFKVTQIIESFHGAACLEFIEGLALLHLEFAEDDFVLRLIIADELDIFDDTFGNMDFQDALRRHFYIRDGDEHVALLEVGIFDLLELLVHEDEVQDAALRHLQDGLQVVRGEDGIAGEFHITNDGICDKTIGEIHAFGDFLEIRTDLREYTCRAKRCHIIADALSRDGAARFALQKRRQLRLDFFRDPVEVDMRDGLACMCFDGCVIVRRKIERGIAHCDGLVGFLHFHGWFRFFRLVGDLTCLARFLTALHVDHGALGHAVLGACHLRCFRKDVRAGKRKQDRRGKQCFLICCCHRKFLLMYWMVNFYIFMEI